MKNNFPDSVGLVLSGGGAKGMAHIGVIRALQEAGIAISHIAGASSGALVGAFHAAGYTWQDTLHFFKDTPLFSFSNYALRKPGFIDTLKLTDELQEFFPENDFSSLQKPLYFTATDIIRGESRVFSEGALIRPLLASAAFPFVLTPVEMNGSLFADGGILNNFPVEILGDKCDYIVGVYVSPLKRMEASDFDNAFRVMERAYHLSITKNSLDKFPACSMVVYPEELHQFGTFSMQHLDRIYQIGYEKTMEAIESGQLIKKQY